MIPMNKVINTQKKEIKLKPLAKNKLNHIKKKKDL